MWNNSKVGIYIIIFFLLFPKLLLAKNFEKNNSFLNSKNYSKLSLPDEFEISIIGKEYIKYLKQIRVVSQKENLNSNLVNSQKKRWISANIKSKELEKKEIKVDLILHGDFNDHISLPYSSLRVKTKNKFFHQLKDFILFKPETRRYEGEIFGTLFLNEIGILAPYSKYIKLSINKNLPENYIFQEKITKYFIERKGFREEPILEYDEKNKWNNYILDFFPEPSSINFFKLDNANYARNYNNFDKIFHSATLKHLNFQKENFANDLFESAMLIMGGCHGLAEHNRKYYFDSLNEIFIPIYYDGMFFYDKSPGLCKTEREKQNIKISKKISKYLENIFSNELLKKKLENKFNKSIIEKDSDKFDFYWSRSKTNFDKYKKIAEQDGNLIEETSKDAEYNYSLYSKLEDLNLPYPTIFYYKDIKNDNFKICYNWFNLDDKIFLETSNEKIIYKKDQGCKKIDEDQIAQLLRGKIYFKTNLNHRIRIYPILVGNILEDKFFIDNERLNIETDFIEKDIDLKKINLNSGTILKLYVAKGVKIKNLIINSSIKNNSALILFLNNNEIDYLEFNQKEIKDKFKNEAIENKNITGCLNILNSNFIIQKIKINGSYCEDGLNIIRSTGSIENLDVSNVISDGVDFDYSNIEVKNLNFYNAAGDCIDLSFGEYKLINSNVDKCGDKGFSAGENSNLILEKSKIYNSNIGIASKDNSKVLANDLILKNVEFCLSAYNKKNEFYGGYIKFNKMKCENYTKKLDIDKFSEIYKNNEKQ